MPLPREARIRRVRGAVALARARLAATSGGRVARLAAGLVVAGFGLVAIVLRISDGPEASLSGLVVSAAHWVGWVAAAPLALAAAEDRRSADRRDGIDALAAARGVSATTLDSARVLGAMIEIAAAVALPLLVLALLTAALAGRFEIAVYRAALGAGAAGFAVVAGVTLGGLGTACGRVAGRRGRWLLFAVVALPWMLADLAGHSAYSIPGALGAVLDFALAQRGGA